MDNENISDPQGMATSEPEKHICEFDLFIHRDDYDKTIRELIIENEAFAEWTILETLKNFKVKMVRK